MHFPKFFSKKPLSSICFSILFFFIAISSIRANNLFLVHHIRLEGLHRIRSKTVRSYLPIHEGQMYTSTLGDAVIRDLYKTGFFDDVCLARKGETLIVLVKERPTIGFIQIKGNRAISNEKLKPILKKMNILVGRVYDPAQLHEITKGLEGQYALLGYHTATVDLHVLKETLHRVALYIQVHEGPIARIKFIRFVGNHVFSQSTLRKQFKLTTSGLFTWLTHYDRYSKVKLQQDLERLSNFYFNHGYLRFQVTSYATKITSDHRDVSIRIHVSEGCLYHIAGYSLISKPIIDDAALKKRIRLKIGEVFSRSKILGISKAIGIFLASKGYAFSSVNLGSHVDDHRHQVFLFFKVLPRVLVYVRHINFFGNLRTTQSVLRREMRQIEGSVYSLKEINESKQRLNMLPYLKDIEVFSVPVTEKCNQVDLNIHVKEVMAGSASVNAGYSDAYGFLYGADIIQPNFMGTGKYVALGIQNSQVQKYYSFNYNNPYYKVNSVSRGFTIYYSHTKNDPKYNLQSYIIDGYGMAMNYGVPLSEYNALDFSFHYDHTAVSNVNPKIAAPSLLNFLGKKNGVQNTDKNYNLLSAEAILNYNRLDRYIFPTKGFQQAFVLKIGLPVLQSSLAYYITSYHENWYLPLGNGFILDTHSTIAYGNGYSSDKGLPFFLHFYAGGLDGGVAGYASNSLGPKNTKNDNAALGGNLKTIVGLSFIFPNFISDKLRTAITLEAGNVFEAPPCSKDTVANGIIQNDTFTLKNLRASAGLEVSWYSPLGPINMSIACPLVRKIGDDTEVFQFSFGTTW